MKEIKIWKLEQHISTKYKVQSTKYKVQSTKYKVQSTKYKVQSTKYKVQSIMGIVTHLDGG